MDLPGSINNSFAPVKPFDLDARLISPDGHWLAFYTGTAGSFVELPASGTSDLTLNLLDLATGEEQVVTPLLSADYPGNFVEAAKKLNDPYITAETLYGAFLNGIIQSLAWSPDGKYLAFAGQIDGLSSDLYLYDVHTQTIQRLSSGDQELQWIDWSPDGKWILHSSVFSAGMGMTFDIYAASLDSGSAPYLSTNSLYTGIERWVNSHVYLENDSENGPGQYGLRSVDIETGKVTKLWDGSYFSYEVSADGKWVIINAMLPDIAPELYSGNDLNFLPGPYLIDLATLEKTRIEFPSDEISIDYVAFPFALGNEEFILMGVQSPSYFLSTEFELSPLELNGAKISISPDRRSWVATVGDSLSIYSADNVLTQSISIPVSDVNHCDLTWMPDSTGVFLVCQTEIYSVTFSTGEIQLVEMNRMDNYLGPRFAWVAGQ